MSNFIPKPKISTINLKLFFDNFNLNNNKKKINKNLFPILNSCSNSQKNVCYSNSNSKSKSLNSNLSTKNNSTNSKSISNKSNKSNNIISPFSINDLDLKKNNNNNNFFSSRNNFFINNYKEKYLFHSNKNIFNNTGFKTMFFKYNNNNNSNNNIEIKKKKNNCFINICMQNNFYEDKITKINKDKKELNEAIECKKILRFWNGVMNASYSKILLDRIKNFSKSKYKKINKNKINIKNIREKIIFRNHKNFEYEVSQTYKTNVS